MPRAVLPVPIALPALLVALGCPSLEPFACLDDEQCSVREGGTCHEQGACSYPDDACASGRRWSETAGALARQCVQAECGNGVVEGDEECDDGDDPVCNACTSECRLAGVVRWSVTHDAHGFADFFDGAVVDPGGDVIAVGRTFTGPDDAERDHLVVRYDAAGTVRWAVAEPRVGRDDLNCVVLDPAGDVIAAGVRRSDVTEREELWVGRYTQAGAQEVLAYGTLEPEATQGQGCTFTTDGRLVVVGQIDGSGTTTDFEKWDRLVLDDVLGTPTPLGLEGAPAVTDERDIALEVAAGPEGSVLVGGNVTINAQTASDRWIASFDAEGAWIEEIISAGPGLGEEEIFGVVVDQGMVFAAGSEVFNDGNTEKAWVAGLALDGLTIDWTRDLGLESPAIATGLALGHDGNLLVTINRERGEEGRTALAQLDREGDCQWLVEDPGGAQRLSSVAVAPDGSIVLTGSDLRDDEPAADALVIVLSP